MLIQASLENMLILSKATAYTTSLPQNEVQILTQILMVVLSYSTQDIK